MAENQPEIPSSNEQGSSQETSPNSSSAVPEWLEAVSQPPKSLIKELEDKAQGPQRGDYMQRIMGIPTSAVNRQRLQDET